MRLRQLGAVVLMYLTACAVTPRALYPETNPAEAELAAARYELHVLTADNGRSEPVDVSTEDFQRAMRVLAREFRPSAQPAETAHWLMEGSLQTDLLAEAEHGHVVRLMPLEDDSPLEATSAAELKRKYLGLCQQEYGGGDCLGLLADGPTLTREDVRTLALALALKDVLKQTRVALKGMVSPQAVIGMIVWSCCVYLTLWLLPEPVSKVVAAGLTLALLAWLPVHTLWGLMDDWGLLVHDVDRATSFEQVQEASAKFSHALGENTAHVLVMVVTTVLTGGTAKLGAQLPKLPGFAQAAAWAEAQGLSLAGAAEIEAAAAADEQTFTLMVRRPRGQSGCGGGGSGGGARGCHGHHPPPGRQPADPFQRSALARVRQRVRSGHPAERPCGRCSPSSGPAPQKCLGPGPSKTSPAQRHQQGARGGRISTSTLDGAHVPGSMGREATAP